MDRSDRAFPRPASVADPCPSDLTDDDHDVRASAVHVGDMIVDDSGASLAERGRTDAPGAEEVVVENGVNATPSTGAGVRVRVRVGAEALRRNQVPEMPGLTNEHASIHLTVDVPPGDARLKTARFRTAARKEAEGLQDRGAFRKTKRCDLPPGANVIKGRFVFTLKEFNTPEEQPKARDVAQGQSDKAKAFVVHSSSTLRQRSTRIILSTSINNDFRIFFHDITQAYLQSQEGFTREIYLDPRPADRGLFGLADDEVLLLILPLYGICDAGNTGVTQCRPTSVATWGWFPSSPTPLCSPSGPPLQCSRA